MVGVGTTTCGSGTSIAKTNMGQTRQESFMSVYSVQEDLVAEQQYHLQQLQQQEQQQQSRYWCCWFSAITTTHSSSIMSNGLWLAMQLGFWQQISGTEAVLLYYSADFLQALPVEKRFF